MSKDQQLISQLQEVFTTNQITPCLDKANTPQIVVVEDDEQLQKILSLDLSENLKAIIQYDNKLNPKVKNKNVYSWNNFVGLAIKSNSTLHKEVEEIAEKLIKHLNTYHLPSNVKINFAKKEDICIFV